ncbi:MAG: ATP-binding protein [Bacteroidales bacterium]|nr:ATP-binding protein [Bacteroidales bacterium]
MMNPFVLTGIIPDEFFCDRQRETEVIITSLENQSNILLTSSRRMGKTQLIRHVFEQKRIKERYCTFYTDIYATSSLQEMAYFLGKEIYRQLVPGEKKALKLFLNTLRSLSAAFSLDPVSGEPRINLQLGDINAPEMTLEEIFSYLENADKPCIVAIDEFQQISRYPDKNVEALLRTHIQTMNNCHFIFAGSDRHILEQMFSSYSKPFYNSAQPLRLGCIDKDKYVDFVVKNFDKAGIAIDSDVAGFCYDEFEGYTYYLHRIFHDIFSFSKEGDSIDKNVIKHTIDSILEENSHSYGKTMAELPMAQKQMLAAVAKERPAKNLTSGAFVKRNSLQSSSSAQKAVIKLLDQQLLTYDVTNGEKEYSVSDKFFERWLREVY